MPKELCNPFRQASETSADLASLAEQGFLSDGDIAKLRELESQKNRSSEFEIRHSMSDVSLEKGMSVGERRVFNESREKRETRQRLIKWAEEFGLGGEAFVDDDFIFDDEGYAVCKKGLVLAHLGIDYFPKGVKEVYGIWDFKNNEFRTLKNFPEKFRDSLILSNNPIMSLEDLPREIAGNLHLEGVPAIEIPAGLNIMGRIFLNKKQKALYEDALAKGYDVSVFYD